MWDIKNFHPASGATCRLAEALRDALLMNELANSRLPDFVKLSGQLGYPCLPFGEHHVEAQAPQIYGALRTHGCNEIIILENPLYEESSKYIASAQLNSDSDVQALIDASLFSGGYVVGTSAPLFTWVGNFTDYGFMFTSTEVIESVFGCPASAVYRAQTSELRLSSHGDALLKSEIQKLDKLWFAEPNSEEDLLQR